MASKAYFLPIGADPKNEPAVFLDAIPKTDSKCLEEIWGVDRYTAIRSGDANIEFDLDEVGSPFEMTEDGSSLYKCLSGETWARFLIGDLFNDLGELSAGTLACVDGKIAERNLVAITSKLGDVILEQEAALEDIELILTEFVIESMPVLFCLNEDERRATEGFGFEELWEMECLLDALESTGMDLYAAFEAIQSDPFNMKSAEITAEFERATLECGGSGL